MLHYAISPAFVRWLIALYAVVLVLIVGPSCLTALMIARTFGAEVWKLTANEIPFNVIFFAFGLIVGLAVPFFGTTAMTVLQETVEPQMHGRVFGLVGIVTAIAMPIGIGVCGPLADRFTVESVLVTSGPVLFLVVVTAVALPSGRLAMDPADRARVDVTSR